MRTFSAIVLALLLATAAGADPIVYPAKGQSTQQQEKDKYECYQWGKQQTGFDPMQEPHATSPPPPQSGSSLFRGAARGAVAGAAIGAIAGDAGKGAAIGAASGGMVGGMRRRNQVAQQQQWAESQASQYQAQRHNYERAYGACLQGRGYTVN